MHPTESCQLPGHVCPCDLLTEVTVISRNQMHSATEEDSDSEVDYEVNVVMAKKNSSDDSGDLAAGDCRKKRSV